MNKPKHYTAKDLEALDRQTLAIIAEARGIDVEGTGRGGYETVEDYRSAIAADQDRTGINPGLVAEPPDVEWMNFTVTGGALVHGAGYGEDMTLPMSPQTELLVQSGALTPSYLLHPTTPGPPNESTEAPDGDPPSDEPMTEES